MRQGYIKPNTNQEPLAVSAPIDAYSKAVLEIADRVQNPLQFVTNFAALNVELLRELRDAMTTGNAAEMERIIQDVVRNCQYIEAHGKRVSNAIMQLQAKR